MYTMYNHRIFHSTRKSEVTKVSEPNLSAMMFETSPLTRDTRTCCRALGSGAVTTFFNDLGLSQLDIEHLTFRFRGERSYPRLHVNALYALY